MKFHLISIVMLLFFSLSATSNNQDLPKKKNIAVIDLESRGGFTSDEIRILTDRLRSILVKSQVFNVLDRSKMNNILEEQGFQLSGCTSAECAVEVGMILGVEEMVTGSIGLIGKLYTIDIILIDVESSKIVKSITRDYTGEIEGLVNEINSIALELTRTDEQYPANNFGSVKIHTEPPGAEVFIDAWSFGVTPATVTNLIPGSHKLELVKSGFTEIQSNIEITKNQTLVIRKTLQKEMILTVKSDPEYSDVYINGSKSGTTPFRSTYPEGISLKIEIHKENYQIWSDELRMDKHRTVDVKLEYSVDYLKQLANQSDVEGEPGGGNTWLWVGAGVLTVGAAVYFLVSQNDPPEQSVRTGFPEPPTR